jgi:hypothetical protein
VLGAGETEPMVSPWHDMPIDLANDATLESFLFGEGVHFLSTMNMCMTECQAWRNMAK